jgi:hypothetical protein
MKKIMLALVMFGLTIGPAAAQWQFVQFNTNTHEVLPDIWPWVDYSPTQTFDSVTLNGVTITDWNQLLYVFYSPPAAPPTMPGTTNDIPDFVAGPLFWYAFNEQPTNGLYFDTGPMVLNLTGGPALTRYPAVTNYSALFTGLSEGYLEASGAPLLGGHYAQISIAYWISAAALPGSGQFLAISTNSDFSADSGITCSFATLGGTNAIRTTLWGRDADGNSGLFYTATNHSDNLFTGGWQRVVITYEKLAAGGDAAQSRLTTYLDGAQIGVSSNVPNWFVTGDTGSTNTELTVIGIGVLPNAGYAAITNDYSLDDIVLDYSAWTLTNITNDFALGRTENVE